MSSAASYMAYSNGQCRRQKAPASAEKQRPLLHCRREGSVGNNAHSLQGFQGIQVPVPLDDFDQAPPTNSVCRAASRSAQAGEQQMTHCARGRHSSVCRTFFKYQLLLGTPHTGVQGHTLLNLRTYILHNHRRNRLSNSPVPRPLMDHSLEHLALIFIVSTSPISRCSNARHLCIHHGTHTSESHHDSWESQRQMLCQCTLACVHLDMRPASGDQRSTLGLWSLLKLWISISCLACNPCGRSATSTSKETPTILSILFGTFLKRELSTTGLQRSKKVGF